MLLVIISSPWFLVALIPLAALILYTIHYYLKTSIEIRRIEAVSKYHREAY